MNPTRPLLARPPRHLSPGIAALLAALIARFMAWMSRFGKGGVIIGRRRARVARPWHIRIRPFGGKGMSQADLERLLSRHQDLQDSEKIARHAAKFRIAESDFFGDPKQVERLLRGMLEANPPWLHLSKVLAGGEDGDDGQAAEVLWREQVTREVRDVTLLIPDDAWKDQPLSSLTLRPARHLSEVWQGRMLDQILPPEVLMDRFSRGEIMAPVRESQRHRLDFHGEQRRIEVVDRRRVPVPIAQEGANGKGGQLLYILLDFSASMRGPNAVLAMATIAAVIRANMGLRQTRYLFRRYADVEDIWPAEVQPPIQARTVQEKDALLDLILDTNFNGRATNVNHALDIAARDIEQLREDEALEASLLLVTDGQAEILESTHRRIQNARIKVHTIMVARHRHAGLETLSESFTALDIPTS